MALARDLIIEAAQMYGDDLTYTGGVLTTDGERVT
jgi:hypothetical protein